MKTKRRRHDPQFKARVALEALKGIKTVQQIAKEYELHPVQVTEWKKQLIEQSSSVFERGGGQAVPSEETFERERTQLHSKIGELTVQLDFLQRKSRQLGLSDELPIWLKKDTRR